MCGYLKKKKKTKKLRENTRYPNHSLNTNVCKYRHEILSDSLQIIEVEVPLFVCDFVRIIELVKRVAFFFNSLVRLISS